MSSSIYILAALFFITAILYSSVGFGGGSSYTALLVLSGTDYSFIPIISLSCNIIVVSGNVFFSLQNRLLDWRSAVPLVMLSVPLSFMAGTLPINERFFVLLLAAMLFLAGIQMIIGDTSRATVKTSQDKPRPTYIAVATGGVLGFASGLVGIGGGIFLAPVLHLLNWASARKIAAICSLFILVNSIAGLLGQLTKLESSVDAHNLLKFWPLIAAVFLGGMAGRSISLSFFSERMIKRLTAILILFVALRLGVSELR